MATTNTLKTILFLDEADTQMDAVESIKVISGNENYMPDGAYNIKVPTMRATIVLATNLNLDQK